MTKQKQWRNDAIDSKKKRETHRKCQKSIRLQIDGNLFVSWKYVCVLKKNLSHCLSFDPTNPRNGKRRKTKNAMNKNKKCNHTSTCRLCLCGNGLNLLFVLQTKYQFILNSGKWAHQFSWLYLNKMAKKLHEHTPCCCHCCRFHCAKYKHINAKTFGIFYIRIKQLHKIRRKKYEVIKVKYLLQTNPPYFQSLENFQWKYVIPQIPHSIKCHQQD